MKREWLTRKIDVQEIAELEQKHMLPVSSDNLIAVKDKLPFGENYFIWRRAKKMAMLDQKNSEIWEFNSGKHSFAHLAGRAGYCLVRGGIISGLVIVTRMN